MSKLIDLTGQRFGNWMVVGKGNYEKGKSYWLCRCECGTIKPVDGDTLRRGKSSGCIDCRKIWRKHGLSGHPLYSVWNTMIQRCENHTDRSFHWYGLRGISVCPEWHEFIVFYEWSIKSGYQDGLTIDRIDGDGNYEPGNCRWADRVTQANNKKCIKLYRFNGSEMNLSQWANVLSLTPHGLLYRIQKHGVEKALIYTGRGKHVK